MFKRITKQAARKLFNQGNKIIYLCPCKMYPSNPFNVACGISGKDYLEQANFYKQNPTLWKDSLEKTAWDIMYFNWAFYNANYETGYYAHYYIEV